jgi:hypothetical protein
MSNPHFGAIENGSHDIKVGVSLKFNIWAIVAGGADRRISCFVSLLQDPR